MEHVNTSPSHDKHATHGCYMCFHFWRRFRESICDLRALLPAQEYLRCCCDNVAWSACIHLTKNSQIYFKCKRKTCDFC